MTERRTEMQELAMHRKEQTDSAPEEASLSARVPRRGSRKLLGLQSRQLLDAHAALLELVGLLLSALQDSR
jgi:hypothetical protein